MKFIASRLVETQDPRRRIRVDLEGGDVDWHLLLAPMAQDATGAWVEDEGADTDTLALVDALAEHLSTLSPDLQESFVRSNIMQRRMRAWIRRWEEGGRTDAAGGRRAVRCGIHEGGSDAP